MGPSQDNLSQVKQDARDTTLRHFRDAVEDNGYEMPTPVEDTRKSLDNIGDPWSEQITPAPAKDEAPADKPAPKTRAKKADQEPVQPDNQTSKGPSDQGDNTDGESK